MLSIFQSSFSNEYLLVCLTSAGVFLATLYSLFFFSSKKLPPLAKGGLLKTMRTLAAGKANPAFYLEKMKELGVVFRISMPDLVAHWVIVCDGALTRKLLMEQDQKATFMQRFVGLTSGTQTIFTQSTNSSWHNARKGVASSFSMNNVALSLPWIYTLTDKLKIMLAAHQSAESTIDVPKLMTHFTLDLISAAMFNTDLGTMTSSSSAGRVLIKHYEVSLREYALKQMVNPFRFLLFWNKDVIAAKASALEINKFQLGLLDSYRSAKTPQEIEKDPSILGHLVRTTYPSDVERCADMTTFILAGHDTIAYSLAWTLIEVTKNPEVNRKLKKEIDSISPGDGHITIAQMNSMTYLDYIIKESMRLWPVASSGISREMSKDIAFNDYIIPKGSVVLFPFICIFRNGIKDPEAFKPDRWLPSDPDAEKLKELYHPFSMGKRNCVGQNLALLEMKMVLATVFRSFRFELVSEVDHDYFMTLKPINAHMRVYNA